MTHGKKICALRRFCASPGPGQAGKAIFPSRRRAHPQDVARVVILLLFNRALVVCFVESGPC